MVVGGLNMQSTDQGFLGLTDSVYVGWLTAGVDTILSFDLDFYLSLAYYENYIRFPP